jgi:carotenoid cleavage dioxygenase-like enzyme
MSATTSLTGNVSNTAEQADLVGNMFPVGDEIDVAKLDVTGELPEGLRGSFVRNGPNPMFEPLSEYHMFDGDGMLHGVTFGDEGASYRNRWIRSRGLDAEINNGRGLYHGLSNVGEFPERELVGSAGPVKNPANTHIVRHAGRMLALWEGGLPTEVTVDLDTVGEYDFAGELAGLSMTAHPRINPRTGEMYFFAYSFLGQPYLNYYAVNADGVLDHKVGIELPAPVMMHDFIITEEHAVFLDSPIVFNLENLGTGPLVSWRPDNGTRLGVMPLRGTADDLQWFDIENGHVQHFWNGYADGDKIHLSGTKLAAPDFGIGDGGAAGGPVDPAIPTRFWIDLAKGEAGWEEFDDMGGDFCRFNDDYNGVESHFEYMSGYTRTVDSLGDFDTIVKYDARTGARSSWYSGDDGHVGESVFAPDPSGTAEDDGWLVNAVYYDGTDSTDVVVLDAHDVDAGPIATVHIPRRIPFGFHANWFGAD